MSYLDLIKQAKAHGVTSEKKMWASIEALSDDLAPIEAAHPHIYWKLMRHQHAILYDRHYSEKFANHDVNALVWSDTAATVPDASASGSLASGPGKGPRWSRSQILEATKALKFHPKVNDWDKYVAFNSMYADLCGEMDEAAIIKAAYLFYFQDKDWQPDHDDCTKIWDYTSLHSTL